MIEPGIVAHGGTYDFSFATTNQGESNVSTRDYLAEEADNPFWDSSWNWYDYYFDLLGSPVSGDISAPGGLISKPSSRETPYYAKESGITNYSVNAWTIADGETITIFVDGNLTINGTILRSGSGTGFIAFIVNGNITVNSTLGVAYDSTSPVIEGIYIADGTFNTGTSATSGSERFVATGTIIANNFSLQRSLAGIGRNDTNSAELFIFDPELQFHIPQALQASSINWQEVVP
jgi:hypothetical protein